MRPAAVILITLLLAAASAALAASPAPTAILPVIGPALDDDRRDLDGALRHALLQSDAVDLLSPVETRQHLLSLAEMGLVCLPEDVACLVKLGLVSNVAWVLVPVMQKAQGRTISVEIGVIDVGAAKRKRTIKGKVSLDDATAMGNLALRAMGLDVLTDRPPDVITPPGDAEGEGEGESDVGIPAAAPSPGAIVTAIGGVAAGVSLVGAVLVELVFNDVIQADKDTRANIQPLGAVLWGTTLLGAVAVGVGIYLLTEEPTP